MAQHKQAVVGGVITGASAEMIEYMRQDFLDGTGDKLVTLDRALAEGGDLRPCAISLSRPRARPAISA